MMHSHRAATRGHDAAPGAVSAQVSERRTLFAGFAVFGALFLVRQSPLYVADDIGAGFGVSQSGQGTLALGIGVGWSIGMVVAWWTASRWSHPRRLAVGLIGATIASAATAVAPSWATLVIAQGLACAFAGSCTPAMMSLTLAAAPDHRRGRDTGIVLSASRLGGGLVAPMLLAFSTSVWGWRYGLAIAALIAAGAAAVSLLTFDVRGGAAPLPGDAEPLRLRRGGRRNLLIAAFGCAALLTWMTVVSQYGLPLVREWIGVDEAGAGLVLALFGLGSAVGAFLVPHSSDRLGRRPSLVVVLVLGASAGVVWWWCAVHEVDSVFVALAVLVVGGFSLGGLPMTLSLIPSETIAVGDPGRAMVVSALFAEVVGGALLPAVGAVVADHRGRPAVLAGAAGLLAVAAVAAAFLHPMPAAAGRRDVEAVVVD